MSTLSTSLYDVHVRETITAVYRVEAMDRGEAKRLQRAGQHERMAYTGPHELDEVIRVDKVDDPHAAFTPLER